MTLNCLIIYNQDLFSSPVMEYLSVPPSVIYISGRADSIIDNSKNLLELSIIESELTQQFELVEGKTCFFNPRSMKYSLYDFYCFNALLSQCYKKYYLYSILNNNSFYTVIYDILNDVVKNSGKKFVYLNFFFKALRKSRIRRNIFDLDILKKDFHNNYSYFFFNDGYDDSNLEKLLDILLNTKLVVLRNDFIIEFFLGLELEELINLSFDVPRLGNTSENLSFPTTYDYDFAIEYQKKMIFKENDFIFHYVLAAHTNYVVLDSQKNNIYIQRFEKKHNFYKFI